MKIKDLKAGDRVYLTINRNFAPVEVRLGSEVVFETGQGWQARVGRSFTQCNGVINKHTTLRNEPALELQFTSLIDSNNTGVARIAYFTIKGLWLYQGETNIATVVPKEVSDKRNEWPYTAYQLPPVNIYRKKIQLVW